MGRHRIISKEARKYIISEIHDKGQMSKSEVAELVRPHCSFDLQVLKEQALNRLVGTICRGIRDVSGARTVFIAKGRDAIVDIETSTSLDLVSAVDDQIDINLKGLLTSKQKTSRRRQELSGQISIFGQGPQMLSADTDRDSA